MKEPEAALTNHYGMAHPVSPVVFRRPPEAARPSPARRAVRNSLLARRNHRARRTL